MIRCIQYKHFYTVTIYVIVEIIKGQRAHEGISRTAKGHMRAPKGTVPFGKSLERTLLYMHTYIHT